MTKKQPSGAANRKKAALKLENELELRLAEKVKTLSSWSDINVSKQYSNAFAGVNKPILSPEEIKAALELPIYGIDPPRVLQVITQILQLQTKGYFLPSADFCDSMLRDEKIYAFLQVRVNSLIGADIDIHAADDSEKAAELRLDVEKNFHKMMPLNQIGEMLRWGLLLGTGLSQILWDTDNKEGKWMPKLSVWHPKYLFYNWAMREFQLQTQDNGQVIVRKEDIQWSLFCPYSEHLPWNRGLIIPLATLYLIRTWLIQWWARHQEKNGQPIIGAITSAEATPEEERLFIQQLTTLSSNAVVRLPQGVEGNKFDLKFIQAQSDLFKGFQSYLDYIDRSIAILILGQDKTTMAKTSGMSIGGNDAGETVREDLMKCDANNLSEHLREKIIKPYIRFNYGEEYEDLAPSICFEVVEEEDLNARATALNLLSQAMVGFNSLGAKIDYAEMFEEFGIKLAESESDIKMAIDPPVVEEKVVDKKKPAKK